MSTAIPEHPTHNVGAAPKTGEFDDDGVWRAVAVEENLAAAIEVARVRNDFQGAVFNGGLHGETHANRGRCH